MPIHESAPRLPFLQGKRRRILSADMANLTPRIRRAIELRELDELSTKETDILLRKQEWKFSRCRGEEALISERFMEDLTSWHFPNILTESGSTIRMLLRL